MYRRSAIQLILPLLLCLAVPAAADPQTTLVGRHEWRVDVDWFGGFSALWMAPDGLTFLAVNDRGQMAQGHMTRANRQIADVELTGHWPLAAPGGLPLLSGENDAEGLAVAPNGTFYVSFEGVHRILRYRNPARRARALPSPVEFEDFPGNGSLEALAIDKRGRLLTLPEDVLAADGTIPIYRWNGQRWSVPFHITAAGWFHPVGADVGPDGRLYVLERSFAWIGFRSRLRRWDMTDTTLTNEQTLFTSRLGAFGNLEGLSIWRDQSGSLRATMIEDDNFLPIQKTEFVEFALPD